MNTIDIGLLEQAIHAILDSLRENSTSPIDVSVDYYWSIEPSQVYNVYSQPLDFTIGQVQEEWQWLREIAQGKKEPTSQSLVWVASVLRAIAFAETKRPIET